VVPSVVVHRAKSWADVLEITMSVVTPVLAPTKARPFSAILAAGLTIGTLDIISAMLCWGLTKGVPPIRILQSVASGWLGRTAAFQGGMRSALLGLVSHYFIAFMIAAVFYVASRKLPFLIRHAVPCGLLYGFLAWIVMNYVIVPLSAIHAVPAMSLAGFISGPIGHPFLVGLPAALFTRKFSAHL
jgi:uncharacterized membrane protein YagU involved in acid resistance